MSQHLLKYIFVSFFLSFWSSNKIPEYQVKTTKNQISFSGKLSLNFLISAIRFMGFPFLRRTFLQTIFFTSRFLPLTHNLH
ncbi:hypothetical protein Hanom_Chr04g00356351 [Helianthus anomalus]